MIGERVTKRSAENSPEKTVCRFHDCRDRRVQRGRCPPCHDRATERSSLVCSTVIAALARQSSRGRPRESGDPRRSDRRGPDLVPAVEGAATETRSSLITCRFSDRLQTFVCFCPFSDGHRSAGAGAGRDRLLGHHRLGRQALRACLVPALSRHRPASAGLGAAALTAAACRARPDPGSAAASVVPACSRPGRREEP